MAMLQAQQKVRILFLKISWRRNVFHYSIAPSPLSNIYATEINNLETGVPKYLEKYKSSYGRKLINQ